MVYNKTVTNSNGLEFYQDEWQLYESLAIPKNTSVLDNNGTATASANNSSQTIFVAAVRAAIQAYKSGGQTTANSTAIATASPTASNTSADENRRTAENDVALLKKILAPTLSALVIILLVIFFFVRRRITRKKAQIAAAGNQQKKEMHSTMQTSQFSSIERSLPRGGNPSGDISRRSSTSSSRSSARRRHIRASFTDAETSSFNSLPPAFGVRGSKPRRARLVDEPRNRRLRAALFSALLDDAASSNAPSATGSNSTLNQETSSIAPEPQAAVIPLPCLVRGKTTVVATSVDQLSYLAGQTICICEVYPDGWAKGWLVNEETATALIDSFNNKRDLTRLSRFKKRQYVELKNIEHIQQE